MNCMSNIVLTGHCQNTTARLWVLWFVQWICFVLFCFQAAWHHAHMCEFIENKLQFKLISISFTARTYLGLQTNVHTHAHTNIQTHDTTENEKRIKTEENEQRQENEWRSRKKETIEKLMQLHSGMSETGNKLKNGQHNKRMHST